MSLRARRRRLAMFATVLWLVGFEFAPLLHVALHDHLGHHHHDAGGAVIADHDDDAHADDEGDAATPTHVEAALAHGRHSLAHHGVAVCPPAPAITKPLPVDRRATFVAAIATIDPISLDPLAAKARGPPLPPV
jgi:hypothetical protein